MSLWILLHLMDLTSGCILQLVGFTLEDFFGRFYAQRQYGTVQCGLFLVDHKTFAVERQL